MAARSPWIVETTSETFERDVIERSRTVPVVVDFWAAWCQPCRMLGPVLERLAEEFEGAFVLVKADTEKLPEVAGAMGVQAIPSVFGLRDGRVVEQFTGLMTEAQVRQWLQRVLPSQADVLVAEARALESADPKAAEEKFAQALRDAPNEVPARVGLARALAAQDRLDEADAALAELASSGLLDSDGETLRAQIAMRRQAGEVGSVPECRAAAEAAPDDLDAQLRLARALAAAGAHEEAMLVCLDVVNRDRQGHGEAARELMVQVFHLLGDDHPTVNDYRRKLAMALY